MIESPYPTSEVGPLMKGMVIGGVGIVHVFLAQFAIGGGMLLAYLEWRRQKRGASSAADAQLGRFIGSYFQTLVLVSFVLGAVTGVAMWLTTILVGARTIGLMVDEFHWLWATEWLCFCVEVAAGYTFVRYGDRLSDKARLGTLVTYAVASWLSLFWINGILSWQLTPGDWVRDHNLWSGFFNPSFLPSLLYRTVVAMTLAALVACLVIAALPAEHLGEPAADGSTEASTDASSRERRRALVRTVSIFLAPMAAMPLLALWYLSVIPEDSRGWIMGGSIAMTMFVGIAAGASLVIGAYAAILLMARRLLSGRRWPFTLGGPSAAILLVIAFAATAAGEFVREGARKPYTVRDVLYSSSLTEAEVVQLRQTGAVVADPWPLRDAERYVTPQLAHGARVVRALCDVCHTMSGANGLEHLVATWSLDQMRHNIAMLQRTKAFMPPFAGNAADVEAVVQLLDWERAGAPAAWPPGEPAPGMAPLPVADPLPQIQRWLDEAGTAPRTGAHAAPAAAPAAALPPAAPHQGAKR